jgi:hypothetical protein
MKICFAKSSDNHKTIDKSIIAVRRSRIITISVRRSLFIMFSKDSSFLLFLMQDNCRRVDLIFTIIRRELSLSYRFRKNIFLKSISAK